MRHLLNIFIAACLAQPVAAHEFWISPVKYIVPPGEAISADFRVGEKMSGSAYAFIDFRSERFDLVTQDGVVEVSSRMGDRPAINMLAPTGGLTAIVHETSDNTLTYDGMERFNNFTEHKDFAWAQAEHAARGLPDDGFVETYRRYAKALVAVGDGVGADQASGLRTEFVALANPYTDDVSAGLPVRLLFEGSPRAEAQVELFQKAPDGEVSVTFHRTDEEGRAVLPVKPGYEYLADAVMLFDTGNDDIEAGAVWHSIWAALTFMVPE
ncbi:MAG: DUF4198 domain-containing protein [Pseudomonadota bacterium]